MYRQSPDNYVDYIGANGGKIFFKSQDGLGRAVNYDGANGNYRAIHSSFIFGALRGGATAKNGLMEIYMDYLIGGGPRVGELVRQRVSNFSVSPNPTKGSAVIKFMLLRPSNVIIRIYNMAGQIVRNFNIGQLTKGYHRITWDGMTNSGEKSSSGSYVLKVVAKEEVTSRIIIIID